MTSKRDAAGAGDEGSAQTSWGEGVVSQCSRSVEVRIYGKLGWNTSITKSPPADEKGLVWWTTFVNINDFRRALLAPAAHVRDVRANIPAMREETGPDPAMNRVVEQILEGQGGRGGGLYWDGIYAIEVGPFGPRRR